MSDDRQDTPIGAKPPRHVAIIMDGNSRWAKRRGLPAKAGHKAGVDAVRAVVEHCARSGVEVLTLFAFSTENWQRPPTEVRALMALFLHVLRREVERLNDNNLRLRVVGDRCRFRPIIQAEIERAERRTASNTGTCVVVAADYGGRWDIVQAARRVAEEAASGRLDPAHLSEARFDSYTQLGGLPPLDLLIRTGGDYRVSNFLLWHAAYAEFYFTPKYWPDFKEAELQHAFDVFADRERRFGGRGGDPSC